MVRCIDPAEFQVLGLSADLRSMRDSPTSSVSSLHSLSGTTAALVVSAVPKPSAPSLTPSLANYYNESLIEHVTGWQADHAERQVHSS
ncbi:hypothetical protein HPB52_002777 [Rhipicephalus sanguineus]|uniref:Uncharacterized protein n=1 Tax=Rhipicephalus sanguineus TaxID=34632 RepID=A0A9D4T6M8_RHISA|nr:hypothetical protein HPB52_002777 [Rhipicephalus sanguineus]